MTEYETVLDFWFEGEPLGKLQMARWWQKSEEQDDLIRTTFAETVDSVFNGECDKWLESAEGRLAAIICLDQFPRNIYRGDTRSFHYDQRALSLCQEGLNRKQHYTLDSLQQGFFVMPLMHSEDLAVQNQCIEVFTDISERAEGEVQKYLKGSLEFAVKHRDIIAQFGRFPHRNTILGRVSTEAELAFLQQPGSSF